MSQTTTVNPTLPREDISAATTPGNVVAAMWDDPALRDMILGAFSALLANKSLLGSKTFWLSVATPFLSWGLAHLGLPDDQQTTAQVAADLMSLVMLGMRLVTKGPITSVLPAPAKPAA